jgi:hypothetical protein
MANVVARDLCRCGHVALSPLTQAMSVGEALESAYALVEQQGP